MKTLDGKRRAAVEILLGTATISDIIKRGDFNLIKEVMEKSRTLGMQTFDQALIELVREGAISEEEATKNADSANNVRLQLKLHRDQPAAASTATPAPAPAAPAPQPMAAPSMADSKAWGLELTLEDIDEPDDEEPPKEGQ
ncbi:twitching motility protein PilU [Atopomonas hussainii]|uniref:Twitching motility protein PilU n=1 Tax=Atopomonas hussainii TaxID=1429083 RepID=A0A1H7NJD1_9GAMM|nr:twitching motility protein PilU [Atopomonas hussainii]